MLVVCFLCLPVPNRKHWICQLKKLLLVKGFLRDIKFAQWTPAKLNPSRVYDYLPCDNYLLLCLFFIVTRDWNTSQKGDTVQPQWKVLWYFMKFWYICTSQNYEPHSNIWWNHLTNVALNKFGNLERQSGPTKHHRSWHPMKPFKLTILSKP